MTFGWTHTHILAMPAKTFFAMLESSRQLRFQRHNQQMHDLCFVSAIGGSADQGWIESTIRSFKNYGWPDESPKKQLQPSGVRMDHKEMAAVLKSVCDVKLRVEHGR